MVGLEERDGRARDMARSIVRHGHPEWLTSDSPEVARRRSPEDRPSVSAGSVICGACESGGVDHMHFFPIVAGTVDGEAMMCVLFLCDTCLPIAQHEAHLCRIARQKAKEASP